MRYRIVVLDNGESPLDFQTELVLASDDRKIIDFAIAQARQSTPAKSRAESVPDEARRGPRGRAVFVQSTDDDAPSGFEGGITFETAKQLSDALGFKKYNAVSMALKKVENEVDKTATLRGVTFIYVDDIKVD